MPAAKLCPKCGNILRGEALADHVPAGRRLGRELLLWLCVAVILAFLWGAGTIGDRVGGVGAIVLIVWWLRRPSRRAAPAAENAAGRYCCDFCHGRFEGEGLREMASH